METEMPTWSLLACTILGLAHCAAPEIPDQEGELSGRNETGGTTAKLPPSSDKADKAKESAPSAPGTA